MIEGLKPYPAYKTSSLPWLGAIPSHWREKRAKYLFREVDERSTTGQEELLSVSHITGVTPRSQKKVTMFMAESTVGHKRCREGDLVVNTMWAWMGALGISPMAGMVSPAYGVYRPHDATSLLPPFAEHLLRSPGYITEYLCRSTGIQSSRLRLYPEQLLRIPLALPPPEEEHLIARFISSVDHRVRRYIRAKQKLIKLLDEQKQAIIHRAVTRGLDASARLKPSGVEWLGDVPAHWEVVPLRRRWSVTDCKHLTVPFVEEGIPLASVREVQSFDLSLGKAKKTTQEWYESLIQGDRSPRRGDLIYCRNVSVGAAAFVGTSERFAMGQDVCLIRSADQDQRYLNYFLHSPVMARQLALLLVGSTFSRINVAEIKALLIAVPPPAEQNRIVAHLDDELKSSERGLEVIRREIALVREYRTRLIADVVTGKLDVREAAARLPDEPADDAEARTESDEDMGDAELDENPEEAEA